MINAGVITASDRGFRGEREDLSGRVLAEELARVPARLAASLIVPDTVRHLRAALRSLVIREGMRLVVTTGGTGVSPRDVTPEATAPLLDRRLPALALAVRWHSYPAAPASVLSRAEAGFAGSCLVINLPGSPRAVRECFAIVLPTLRWLFGSGGAPS